MRQRFFITLAVAAVALVATTAALAGTLTPTATVTGASGISMALPADPSISDTLDGTDQTVSWTALLGVVDARGTGAGWNLTVSATSFSDGSGHSLSPGTITGITTACQGGNACTAATNGISYPLTLSGTAQKFFNAAANTGMGKVNVTPSVSVAVPGNTYAGTYTSTVTLAAVSGP
jgi:hypothetical protein